MPFRLNEHRAKVQFLTSAAMPNLIYRACLATETPSNTRYIQEAVCERLSKDLNIPLETLLAQLPPCRGMAGVLHDRPVVRVGPGNTVEEVT